MIRALIMIAAATLAALGPGPARAEPLVLPRVVIELFTSQGCSSCPPADRILSDLAGEADVVALSLPVDYWDYLGWKDTFAQPAFSARQRAYAMSRGERQVFTPQTVINGVTACIGSDRAKIDRYVGKTLERRLGLSVPVTTRESGANLVVEIAAASGDTPRDAEIWGLAVARKREVAVGRGENGGRVMTYVNVVRAMKRLGAWHGEVLKLEAPLELLRHGEADGYVVLLQVPGDQSPGRILGAAKGPGL